MTGVERLGDVVDVGEAVGEFAGDEAGDLNSQRPTRRKQAGQDKMPETGEVGSALQPRRARVRARVFIEGGDGGEAELIVSFG